MKTSDQLVIDFYKNENKRYRMLVFGLLIIILINITGLFWLRAEQRKSNKNLTGIANTLSNDIHGRQEQNDARDNKLQKQHEQLLKAIICVIALHDSSQFDANKSEECERTVHEVHDMNPDLSTPSTSSKEPAGDHPKPQNSGGGEQEPEPVPPKNTPSSILPGVERCIISSININGGCI